MNTKTSEDLVIAADEMGNSTDDGKQTAFILDSVKRHYKQASEKDKFDYEKNRRYKWIKRVLYR